MKLFSHTKEHGKKYAQGSFAISPQRNFRHLMMIAVFLLVVVIGLHLYLFYRIQSRNIFSGGDTFTPQSQKVNERKLEDVLVRYSVKDAARTAASTRTPRIIDPSR